MEGGKKQSKPGRRLLLFPAPLQGHVTPMLHLGTILHSEGFSITIIQTLYNSPDPTNFPDFTFRFIEAGLPDKSISPSPEMKILSALNSGCLEPFRDCLSQIMTEDAAEKEPIACLIADPIWRFTAAVAGSYNLPRIALRTGSMSALLVYSYLPLLREKGYFPLQESKLEEPLPELQSFKLKDLPQEPLHELLTTYAKEMKTYQGIICNTFEELEGSSLAKLQEVLPTPVFPIGPLHSYSPTSAVSLWEQDKSSISWLNTQAPKSVLYVSFGSVAAISEAEFHEIAWGLANSKQPFLWVVHPRLIKGSNANDPWPEGYLDKVRGRGQIVKWAPQQEVLAHAAVGGFWTHCGWNSTVESICGGLPMICQPFFSDQGTNARLVSDNWEVGLQLEKGTTRDSIVTAIRRLMVKEEGIEMRNKIATLKEKAIRCLKEGGSSYKSLKSLTSYLLSI